MCMVPWQRSPDYACPNQGPPLPTSWFVLSSWPEGLWIITGTTEFWYVILARWSWHFGQVHCTKHIHITVCHPRLCVSGGYNLAWTCASEACYLFGFCHQLVLWAHNLEQEKRWRARMLSLIEMMGIEESSLFEDRRWDSYHQRYSPSCNLHPVSVSYMSSWLCSHSCLLLLYFPPCRVYSYSTHVLFLGVFDPFLHLTLQENAGLEWLMIPVFLGVAVLRP